MARRDIIGILSEKPVVIYDGSCCFCERRVARWRDVAGDRMTFVPTAEAEQSCPVVRELALNESVHLIEPSGRVSRGAQAVFRMRELATGRALSVWLYDKVPGFRYVAERVYRLVARHRMHGASSQVCEA